MAADRTNAARQAALKIWAARKGKAGGAGAAKPRKAAQGDVGELQKPKMDPLLNQRKWTKIAIASAIKGMIKAGTSGFKARVGGAAKGHDVTGASQGDVERGVRRDHLKQHKERARSIRRKRIAEMQAAGVLEKRARGLRLSSSLLHLRKRAQPESMTGPGTLVQIAKVSESENLVFGYGLVSQNSLGQAFADIQDDVVEPKELERSVYQFMEHYADSGLMHQGDDPVGRVVESFVLTPEKAVAMGIAKQGDSVPTRWWIGVRVHDQAVMQGVRDGVYRAFSVQGSGFREMM